MARELADSERQAGQGAGMLSCTNYSSWTQRSTPQWPSRGPALPGEVQHHHRRSEVRELAQRVAVRLDGCRVLLLRLRRVWRERKGQAGGKERSVCCVSALPASGSSLGSVHCLAHGGAAKCPLISPSRFGTCQVDVSKVDGCIWHLPEAVGGCRGLLHLQRRAAAGWTICGGPPVQAARRRAACNAVEGSLQRVLWQHERTNERIMHAQTNQTETEGMNDQMHACTDSGDTRNTRTCRKTSLAADMLPSSARMQPTPLAAEMQPATGRRGATWHRPQVAPQRAAAEWAGKRSRQLPCLSAPTPTLSRLPLAASHLRPSPAPGGTAPWRGCTAAPRAARCPLSCGPTARCRRAGWPWRAWQSSRAGCPPALAAGPAPGEQALGRRRSAEPAAGGHCTGRPSPLLG